MRAVGPIVLLLLARLCVVSVLAQSQIVSQLTGEQARNSTRRVNIAGTDLGIAFEFRGRVYFMFGDSYGYRPSRSLPPSEYDWRSNTLAIANDFGTDPIQRGVWLTVWTPLRANGTAAELISSAKREGIEVTTIPTAVWANDQSIYFWFMSVKHWGDPGRW